MREYTTTIISTLLAKSRQTRNHFSLLPTCQQISYSSGLAWL